MRNLTLSVFLLLSASSFTGCSALSDKAVEYAQASLEKKIDEKLASRDLSIEELKKNFLTNGKVDSATLISVAKDAALLEGKKTVDQKITELQQTFATKADVSNTGKDTLNYIIMTVLTMLSGYLGKQVVSAKNDGLRDGRIMVLEKSLQRDIDGDGQIGDAPKV